jgi:hypothetical protein
MRNAAFGSMLLSLAGVVSDPIFLPAFSLYDLQNGANTAGEEGADAIKAALLAAGLC